MNTHDEPICDAMSTSENGFYDQKDQKKVLGQALRDARNKTGLSIEDFSSMIGITKNTLGVYERGQRLPDIDVLASIALHAAVNLKDLIAKRLAASDQQASVLLKNALDSTDNKRPPLMVFPETFGELSAADFINENLEEEGYGIIQQYLNGYRLALAYNVLLETNLQNSCSQEEERLILLAKLLKSKSIAESPLLKKYSTIQKAMDCQSTYRCMVNRNK